MTSKAKYVLIASIIVLLLIGCASDNTYILYDDDATIEKTYPDDVRDDLNAFFNSITTPAELAKYFDTTDNFRYDYPYLVRARNGKIRFAKGSLPHRRPEYLWVAKRGVCTETANFARIWLLRNGYETKLLWFTNSYGRTHTVCVFKYTKDDPNWYILLDSRRMGEIQGPYSNFEEVEKRIFNQGAKLKDVWFPTYGY